MPKQAAAPKAPDIEFGIKWNITSDMPPTVKRSLLRRTYLARTGIVSANPLHAVSVAEHRKAIIRTLWSEEFLSWHYWQDRRIESVANHNFVMWMGGGGCLSGDAEIYNPITKKSTRLDSLYRDNLPHHVMTLFGPRMAMPPVLMGKERLLEIQTRSGKKIRASKQHLFLTDRGFIPAEQIISGDILAGYAESHPRSNLERGQSVRVSNARSFPKKAEGFQGSCSGDSNRDDEPLRSHQVVSQAFGTSRIGALEYSHPSSRLGALASEFHDNRLCSHEDRPSMKDFSPSDETWSATDNPDYAQEISSQSDHSHQLWRKWHGETLPRPTSSESYYDECSIGCWRDNYVRHRLGQSCGIWVAEDLVVSITVSEIEESFYDFTVPGAHHYFANGVIHHNCGKTVDAAAIALEYWLEDPSHTAVIVCSTTKEMLRTRIWGQIVKLHSQLPVEAKIGDLLDTACFIRWADANNPEGKGDWLNGIKGVAVQDGPIEEAVNNIVGMHTTRVFVILDEAQGVREAIMAAIPNLLKNPESKMLIMGNPADFNSLLCRYGAPIDGWDSIPKFSEQWETKTWGYKGTGIGLYFDGYKSPAVLDPEWGRKHPWMTSQEQIDAHLNSVGGNENDPGFMVQTRGWPPSKGIEQTLLDEAIVQTFHCDKPPIWTHGKTSCAALDSAFGGSDKSVLQFGWRGWVEDEDSKRWVIAGGETLEVPIDAESEIPIDYQITTFCQRQCEQRNIPANELAVAASGRAGSLVSIFRKDWGSVVAIEEGGAPSDRKVGPLQKTAKETYDTKASELGFLLREFALANGIRSLPQKAKEQACKRLTYNMRGKSCMEPKVGSKGRIDERTGKPVKGFKERLGYSPDHQDAFQTLVEHCRRMGAEPGMSVAPRTQFEQQQEAKESDALWSDSNYTQTENFAREFHANQYA